MLGKRVVNGIDLSRLGAKLTLAAVLSAGLTAAVATPQVWAQSTPAAVRSDAEIQRDVAYALSNSKSLKAQHITAATVEGDVTVSGNVRDEASKELAESLIYRVSGVHTVTNNLVVGDNAPAAVQGQGTVAENTVQSADPNANQQDPNYDPAQQNMAPAAPEEQAQSAPPAPGAPDQPQYPASAPSPRQPYSPQQQYGQQPQYGQSAYAQQQPEQPQPPVTIPSGTLLQIRTSEPLDATRVQPGQVFSGTAAADVYQGSVLAIPRGAVVTGKVVATQGNKGDLAGKQGLSLALTSINLAGQSYPLPTDTWSGQGPGKGGYSAGNTIGGAGIGAVIGAIAGGGAGAAIGAGVGGLVGAGASAATTGPRMYLPAEAVVNFHLTAPVTVTPVSAQEAQRLASSSQPQLQRRGAYPYRGYPPPPPPPGYYYYPYRYPVVYSPYYYGYRY
jgi:hypothetical protein